MLMMSDTRGGDPKPIAGTAEAPFGFYCCGPTVYGPAHIGNFRTFVAQDVFRRVAELSGVTLKHVRNITDVDDKTIRVSQEEGKSLTEFTEYWTEIFHADCTALNLLEPHVEPAAVEHIPEQITLIEQLIAKGHAYVGEDGSVYFNIGSFESYGGLSKVKERELATPSAEAQLSDEYGKATLADFALWKARKPEDGPNYWASPWGEGRPGWHLECSAMSMKYLGETLDAHSGGIDLIFPHHENEIAQSEAATGQAFCKHWFHVAHLMVDGGKMAKSLGNLYTIADLAERGHSPAEVRYLLVSGHYRKPINFTLEGLQAAKGPLKKLAAAVRALEDASGETLADFETLRQAGPEAAKGRFSRAWELLLDNLNGAGALGEVFSELGRGTGDAVAASAGDDLRGLAFIVHGLGLTLPETEGREAPPEVVALAEERIAARTAKEWAEADRLRDAIAAAGWTVKDNPDGYELAAHD